MATHRTLKWNFLFPQAASRSLLFNFQCLATKIEFFLISDEENKKMSYAVSIAKFATTRSLNLLLDLNSYSIAWASCLVLIKHVSSICNASMKSDLIIFFEIHSGVDIFWNTHLLTLYSRHLFLQPVSQWILDGWSVMHWSIMSLIVNS